MAFDCGCAKRREKMKAVAKKVMDKLFGKKPVAPAKKGK